MNLSHLFRAACLLVTLVASATAQTGLADWNKAVSGLPNPPPIKQSFWHSEEFKWKVASTTATALDLWSTQHVLSTCPGCREANPIFGTPRPSAARMVAIGLPIHGAFSLFSHYYWTHGHKTLGRILDGEIVGIHLLCTGLNSRSAHGRSPRLSRIMPALVVRPPASSPSFKETSAVTCNNNIALLGAGCK